MKKIRSVKDGVESLLSKNQLQAQSSWAFVNKTKCDMTDSLILSDEKYPLLYWRSDPQIEAIARNAIKNIGGSISLKVSGMVTKDYGLDAFLYKALDVTEWVLDSEIKKITAYINKNAANVTVLMKNDKVALLELNACLPKGCEEQVRYTSWGKEGLESTRVVSTKLRPQSVYLFTDRTEPYEYNDATLELYGFSLDDATKAVAIFKAITEKTSLELFKERDAKLKSYIEKVYESNKTNQSIEL